MNKIRVEPIVGTDLRVTGRPEPMMEPITFDIPCLCATIDLVKTNFNDVQSASIKMRCPFMFHAEGDGIGTFDIQISTEEQKQRFLDGMDFMWICLSAKHGLYGYDEESSRTHDNEQSINFEA